jgi:large subunit ribosomal protein L24
MTTTKARKQRYNLYNAPIHQKRKWISSHLAENLLLKYDKRSLPVVKGDTVKVMRGSYRGHEDKVAKVNVNDQTVNVEGVIVSKAKGTKVAKPLHASTLLITKLNLTDKWRREKIERGLSETAKKEVEKEAEEQLKAQKEEQERARAEAERAAKEAEAAKAAEEEAAAAEEAPTAPEAPAEKPAAEPAAEEPAPAAEPAKKPAPKKAAKPKKEEGEA